MTDLLSRNKAAYRTKVLYAVFLCIKLLDEIILQLLFGVKRFINIKVKL